MCVLFRRDDGFDVGQYQFLKNFIVIGVKAMDQYYQTLEQWSFKSCCLRVMVPCWWIADWSRSPPTPTFPSFKMGKILVQCIRPVVIRQWLLGGFDTFPHAVRTVVVCVCFCLLGASLEFPACCTISLKLHPAPLAMSPPCRSSLVSDLGTV